MELNGSLTNQLNQDQKQSNATLYVHEEVFFKFMKNY
jgi:hypothetical protein